MKKAGLNISLENLIGLVIGTVLIIGLIFFVANISELFMNKPEQGTINSFTALNILIKQLIESKEVDDEGKAITELRNVKILPNKGGKKGELYADISFFMQDDYGLIGFDRNEIKQTCGAFDPELEKPDQCLKVPCLCLAKTSMAFSWRLRKITYENCETLKNIRYISAVKNLIFNLGEEHELSSGNNNLALWSECGTQSSFKVRNLRVLKVLTQEENKYDILFANVPE